MHDGGEREHDRGSDQSLQGAGGDLSQRDERHGHGREHAVLDLLRVAELGRHRQRDRLDALEHDGDPDHARNQDAREGRFAGRPAATTHALTDLREHIQENEYEQERLDERAADELAEVLLQHREVALEERPERLAARLDGRPAATCALIDEDRRCHQSRSSFPVRLMKTVSRVGSATARS